MFRKYFEKIEAKLEKLNLKDELSLKEKLVTELERETTNGKQTIKNLLDEINSLVKFKNENEELKKELKKVQKELKDLKEKGVVMPKKVKSAGPTKKDKETIGMKPSNTSVATKKELKEINELREKEE